MTIFRTNPILIVIMATLASLALSAWAGIGNHVEGDVVHDGITKAAFIFASGLMVRYFAVAVDFAKQFKARSGAKRATYLDMNAQITVFCAFVAIGGAVALIGVGQFADSAFEALTGAALGGISNVIDVFTQKDAEGDAE